MTLGLVVNENASVPASPDADYRALYPQADGWHELDSAGNDRLIVAGYDVAHTWTAAQTFQRTIAVGGGEADVVVVDEFSGNASSFISHTHYTNGSTGFAQFVMRQARGTRASPTATQSGDSLGVLQARGYGATQFATSARGYIQFAATENWTDAAQGAGVNIYLTPTGSATGQTALVMAASSVTSFLTASFGANDSYGAILELYGPATGTEGGELRLYNSGDYDATFQSWNIDSNTEALRVFRSDSVGGVALAISPTATGATVYLGASSDSAQFPVAVYVRESAHASSRRATVQLGGSWIVMADSAGNGTRNFALYDVTAGAVRFSIDTTGMITSVSGINLGNVTGAVVGGIRATMDGSSANPILALYNRLASSGVRILLGGKDSLINDQTQAEIVTSWATDSTATRRARAIFYIHDSGGARTAITLEAAGAGTGAVAMLGFFGASAITRPTVTGSRGGNAALASLLTELANLGLITNSTS